MILVVALDLTAIKSEMNLERRSDLALEFAATTMDTARDAYQSGDIKKWQAELEGIRDAIELSYQSLVEAGKNARNDRHYKHAELKTRELLRRLDGQREDVDFEDRGALDQVRAKISEVHDELLERIMSKKK